MADGKLPVCATMSTLLDLHETFSGNVKSQEQPCIRGLLRKLGHAASVEIEPPFQTTLLDYTEQVAGVVAAGVPGGIVSDILNVCLKYI